MKTTALLCLLGHVALGAEAKTYAKLPQVPVGIAVSSDSRVFVAFSRAIDPTVSISVAELVDGKPRAFPPGFEQGDGAPAPDRLLSVQSVFVDEKDRLWMLDTGKVGDKPVASGGPKLVAYDLKKNAVVQRIPFGGDVAGAGSFLNDLRVDLSRGNAGTVYLTDAAPKGPNAIVIVDIASGKVTRALEDHASVRADPAVKLTVEGRKLVQAKGPDEGKPFNVGADGIALSPDAKFLYYCPLTSRHLYRVPTDALFEANAAKAVEDLGDKGFAADGLWMDEDGRLYVTDFENGAVKRRAPDGKFEVVAHFAELSWPDTFAMLPDGRLLVTATQIHRSDRFRGRDERVKPFQILSIATDGKKERLGRRAGVPVER